MQKPKLASRFDCTGCLACVDICKHDALTSFVDSDGHNYVRINDEACVGCLQCEHVCPVVNKYDYSSNVLRESIPFAAYCKDEGIYMKSTSGGVFAVLARQFIKEGGFVCGVVMQNNHAFHIMTNKMEDVERMQGSKYLQSNTEGVYLKIKDCMKDGHKVLFCGMGCQAAAVCSYFRKNKNRNLLYVVDMICGGVPSQHLVDRFIRSEERWSEVVSFRKKGQYVLTCRNIDREPELLSNVRPLPLYGFFSGLTNRYSCGDCKFAGVERESDITIGDYWGDNSSIHKSVAIVHSQKGKELLMNCNNLDVFKTDWNFLKFNYRTIVGKTYNNYRWQRRLLPWIFKHLSYKNICGFYGCHFRNPLLFFVYAITKLESMLIRRIIRMEQHKIIRSIMKQSDKIDSRNWLREGK